MTKPSIELAPLTRREQEILNLLCDGLSNKEIARRLNITDGTCKVHLHHMFDKLAVHSRLALVAYVLKGERP